MIKNQLVSKGKKIQKNGGLKWWKVYGLRHNAVVKARTGKEAVLKAEKAQLVYDWELPEAVLIGDRLPDAFSI